MKILMFKNKNKEKINERKDMEEIICLEHKNEAICKKKDSQKIDNKIEGYWKCAEGLNSIYSLSALLKQNQQ